jgi:hypothetical protein
MGKNGADSVILIHRTPRENAGCYSGSAQGMTTAKKGEIRYGR